MSSKLKKTSSVSIKKKSGHFNYLVLPSEKYERILETIENSSSPITPKEISSSTKINPATVRKYVRKLEKMKHITKVFYGHYVSTKNLFTSGGSIVKSDCPKLHCLRLRIVDFIRELRTFSRDFGYLKLVFQHYTNGSVTVFVDCVGSYSLDYVAFRLLVDCVLKELCLADWEKISVSSFEFNNDFEGVRLDGVQAVTLKAFDGSFRRMYQKHFGVRDEVKVVGSVPVENVLTLLKGGVDSYNISQLLFGVAQEIRAEREAVKFLSGLVIEGMSSLKRYWEAIADRATIETTTVKTNMQTQTKKTKVIHRA